MNTNINPDTPENYSPQPHNGTAQIQTEPQTEEIIGKPFSAWLHEAKAKPPITPLFDVFWLKGELAFMFGATGIGKSILAVQIADAIAKGAKIQGFDGTQTPMKVGYFDFELSAHQLLKRYSDEKGNVYQFSDNFLISEIDPNKSIPKGISFQDYILAQIEQTIIEHRLEVVVIDSLTYMPIFITEKTNYLDIMHQLRLIKMRQNISMLVVGHSLRQDSSLPITEDDMPDSIYLLSLCGSVFAIGKSAKEKNVHYLKQIKCSSSELIYDSENVALFQLVKRNSFLGFEHIGFDDESEHLCDFS